MAISNWNELKSSLITTFNQRSAIISLKGGRNSLKPNGFTALFIKRNCEGSNTNDSLSNIIELINAKNKFENHQSISLSHDDEESDDIAMMGHRIGIIENVNEFVKYLTELFDSLKPNDQVLITALNNDRKNNNSTNLNSIEASNLDSIVMKSQYGDFFGPYFGLFVFDISNVKAQVDKTEWSMEVMYEHENNEYVIRLYSE